METRCASLFLLFDKARLAIGRLLARREEQSNPDRGVYVPERINWEVEGNNGTIGRDTLRSVLQTPGFEELSIALGVKLFQDMPEREETLLRSIVANIRQRKPHKECADILDEQLKELPSDTRVNAMKIGQVFRTGPYYFRSQFDELAAKVKAENKIPCLIAYSALLGLRSFVEQASPGDSIVIVKSAGLGKELSHCGYVIHIGEQETDVVPIHTNTNLALMLGSTPAVLVDDTIKNGTTTRNVRDKFAENVHFPTLETEPMCVCRSGNGNGGSHGK